MSINDIVVDAELHYRNDKGKLTCYLLGSDGYLYGYNNVQHYVSPFSQKPINKIKYEDSKIKEIINQSRRIMRNPETI